MSSARQTTVGFISKKSDIKNKVEKVKKYVYFMATNRNLCV